MIRTPFLEDEKIYLCGFSSEDVVEWTSWFNNPATTEYMNKGFFPVPVNEQMKRLDDMCMNKSELQLAIFDKESNLLLGTVGLHKIDWVHRTGDISIVIGSKEGQGKGYGKRAVALVVRHAFNKLNLHKITSGMWSNNSASESCFKANGFQQEGCRKEQFHCQGRYVDELNYGLLRSQWLEYKTKR